MNTPSEGPQTDNRKYRRFASIKSGLVELDGAPVPVRITDMSAAGARLEPAKPLTFPAEFRLILHADDPAARKTVNCRLRWQRKGQLGVSFF